MAQQANGVDLLPSGGKFGLGDLWRLGLWGMAAGGALMFAVYAGMTPSGQDRLRLAVHTQDVAQPKVAPPQPFEASEGQKLADAVRVLTADRDRLRARLTALERGLEDVTGSIARVEKAAQSQPAAPEAGAAPTSSVPAEEDLTSSIQAPANPPTAQPASPPWPPGKPEFGLDLGGANTVDGLRHLWSAARSRHGSLLGGLRPIVHVRERPRPGTAEFPLVVGPIPNAATAARMCATLAAAGSLCQPSAFEGQRLAVR